MTRRLVIVETTTELQGIMTVARQSETEVRCDRCRHWGSGECERLNPENAGEALTVDNTCCGCSSWHLMTAADFGCPLFTPREGTEAGK